MPFRRIGCRDFEFRATPAPDPFVKLLRNGARLSCMEFNQKELYQLINLVDSPLWLVGADLSEANLSRAPLREADPAWSNLHGADLRGADLEGASLRNANLAHADLRNANLKEANLEGANLEGVKLQGATMPDGRTYY